MKQSRERSIFLPLLAVSFITLRLCGVIDWPWIWVLAPVWLPGSLALFIAVGIKLYKVEKHGKEKQGI